MKSGISAALLTHLAGNELTLATLWKIERTDAAEEFYTTFDENITYDGDLYLSTQGFDTTSFTNEGDLSVDSQTVTALIDTTQYADISTGAYDNAAITIYIVNWADLTMDAVVTRRGFIGEIAYQDGKMDVELQSLAQLLNKRVGKIYTPENLNPDGLGDGTIEDEATYGTAAEHDFRGFPYVPGPDAPFKVNKPQ